MKIYTKTGDKGETSLFTGERVLKNAPYIEALGCADECNSAIGAALSFLPEQENLTETKDQLILIQHLLFDLGAALATPRSKAKTNKVDKTRFDHEATPLLESWIDAMDEKLPKLKTFILPGGHPASAMLHVARGLTRRLERMIIPLNKQGDASDNVLAFTNRLSDYLFVAARAINLCTHSDETLWEHHRLKQF